MTTAEARDGAALAQPSRRLSPRLAREVKTDARVGDRDCSEYFSGNAPMKSPLVFAFVLTTSSPVLAQSTAWSFDASVYGWLPGMSTTIDTPFGAVDSDVSGSDAISDLDMAFMGTFEARRDRWGVIGDLLYVDLSSSNDTPFGLRFSDTRVKVKTAAFSGYVTYRVYDEPAVAIDVAGGFRAFGVDIDTSLNSADSRPSFNSEASENWVDPLIGARFIVPITEKWFSTAFFDVGGTGPDDNTWQAFASIGYRLDSRWSAQLGYRYMAIEKEIGEADSSIDLYGPLLGVTAHF